MSRKSRKAQQQRQQFMGFLLPVLGIVVLVGVYWVLSGSSGTSQGSGDCLYEANMQENGITVSSQTPDGNCVQLSDYGDDVVMLNFWATWCPPCRAEMPTIQDAYNRYSDQGFTVLAINNQESAGTITPFVNTYGLTFPVAMDQRSQIAREFGVNSFPTSIFIKDGQVIARKTGMISASELERYIQQGLNTS